ncbi:MAG: hypothetical protein KJ709_00370 [Nanoarchaeota archaeon]|nr:hypothetical protein [Nanoarchaeota archaeon]
MPFKGCLCHFEIIKVMDDSCTVKGPSGITNLRISAIQDAVLLPEGTVYAVGMQDYMMLPFMGYPEIPAEFDESRDIIEAFYRNGNSSPHMRSVDDFAAITPGSHLFLHGTNHFVEVLVRERSLEGDIMTITPHYFARGRFKPDGTGHPIHYDMHGHHPTEIHKLVEIHKADHIDRPDLSNGRVYLINLEGRI